MKRTKPSPVIDRVIAWSVSHPLSAPTRYLAATLAVATVALIRAAFITDLLPWLLFMPVTLLIALTMGRRTALYGVLLSAAAAGLSVAHPGATLWLTGPQWTATLLYLLISGFNVAVGAEVRAAFLRAQQHREALVAKEAQSQLLAGELAHRLKNLLTIIQAVAGQTLRQATDLKSAGDALASRLAAFGRAADVLTAASWEAADLHTLASSTLSHHDALADRFRIAGPPVRFDAQVALALALAFHELATNATKYGALANDLGHVDLSWRIAAGPNAAERRFHLTWQEKGGPPVRPPEHRGFGSVMIERSLQAYFRGSTAIAYEPDGLVFTIDAPLVGALAESIELCPTPSQVSNDPSSSSTTSR